MASRKRECISSDRENDSNEKRTKVWDKYQDINSEIAVKFLKVEEKLSEELKILSFGPPVTHVYNPLVYALETHSDYVLKYCRGKKKVLFLGMNPGPFGMAQNGVPFGDTEYVTTWLGITGNVNKPETEHPKRPIDGLNCKRSEVSGTRLWGFFKEHCKTPEVFFKNCFIHNYCPLVFIAKSGKNITPPTLKATEKQELFDICDSALVEAVKLLEPEVVVGVGKFAEERARKSLKGTGIKVCGIMHPSPASPAANSGWANIAVKQLTEQGLMDCVISP